MDEDSRKSYEDSDMDEKSSDEEEVNKLSSNATKYEQIFHFGF